MSVASSSKKGDFDALSSQQSSTSVCNGPSTGYCTAIQSSASSQQSDAHVATAAYVIAGAFAAGAVAMWLWPTSSEASTHSAMWVAPSISHAASGFAAGGSF